MRTLLTPNLLGFLIEKGYKYCLAQIQVDNDPDTITIVTLTPVKYNPRLEGMTQEYDSYFKITREPMQMALGVTNAEIYISLDLKKTSKQFILKTKSETVIRMN